MSGVSSASSSGGLSDSGDLGPCSGRQAAVVMTFSIESSAFWLTPTTSTSSFEFDHIDFQSLTVPRMTTIVAGTSRHGGADDGNDGDDLAANRESSKNNIRIDEREESAKMGELDELGEIGDGAEEVKIHNEVEAVKVQDGAEQA